MKSPIELSERLAKQWQNGNTREQRLLSADAWPIQLAVGLPSAQIFVDQPVCVREHIAQWRKVTVGQVIWEKRKYIESSDPVTLPASWQIDTPTEWVAATANTKIQQEFKILERIIGAVDSIFHSLIIRKRQLVIAKPVEEVIQATQVALDLLPNCAQGKPLRALSVENYAVANCDSKFFERNRNLIIQLLDVRFNGAASDLGLEQFLGAVDEKDHWLLIVPLDTQLLPFQQLRIRTTELVETALPAAHIIIVENERCLHQLPMLSDTIAILGAGLNLSWLKAPWLRERRLAYWGDMDTWGLLMLSNARAVQPHITALLMNQAAFDDNCARFAVPEPQKAQPQAPFNLTREEGEFYMKLFMANNGRLEQEFLPGSYVLKKLTEWHSA